jgi:hypothetical protein
MVDVFVGQKFKSKFDSYDINSTSKEILFPAGSIVEVSSFNSEYIALKFPDGVSYRHNWTDLSTIFESLDDKKQNSSEKLTKEFKGIGTPPKALFPLMPSEAKWDYNYFYKVTIELEEQSRKNYICLDCYNELPGDEESLRKGVECSNCLEIKTPISVDSILPG